jgi:hypothetical protein
VEHPRALFSPLELYLLATQTSQIAMNPTMILNLPGPHDSHAEEPALENPLSQGLQTSVAPVLYVSRGQSSVPVRSDFALLPATTTLQYADPLKSVYVPSALQR